MNEKNSIALRYDEASFLFFESQSANSSTSTVVASEVMKNHRPPLTPQKEPPRESGSPSHISTFMKRVSSFKKRSTIWKRLKNRKKVNN